MPWWGWVIVVAAAVLLPIGIGMLFGAGRGMSGGASAAGGAIGVFEEFFSPGRAEARQEQERDRVRKVDSAQGGDQDPSAPPVTPAAATGPVPDTIADGIEQTAVPPGWLGTTARRPPAQGSAGSG